MLHHIFQRHHLTPDEIYNKPPRVRAFIYASTIKQIEDEEKSAKAR